MSRGIALRSVTTPPREKKLCIAVGVIDTGEHGAMVSQAVLEQYKVVGKCVIGALERVEVMLWGVSSYALVLEHYDEILATAEKEARLVLVERRTRKEVRGKAKGAIPLAFFNCFYLRMLSALAMRVPPRLLQVLKPLKTVSYRFRVCPFP